MTKLKHLLVLCFAVPALAFAELEVSDAWVSKPIAGVKNAAGYMTLSNIGTTAVEVVAVGCEMAKMCQIHKTIHEDGGAKMRQQKIVSIEAGGSLEFKPGGLHIMVMDVSDEFFKADRLPISLTLSDGEVLDAELLIRAMMKHSHH